MKKRAFGVLLSLALMIGLMPGMTIAAYADDAIQYVSKSWNGTKVVSETKDCTNYTVMQSGNDYWRDGTWYVVKGDVRIKTDVVVDGTVNLIICDGAKLTVTEGISVVKSDVLNIYAQSDGNNMGVLNTTGSGRRAGIGGDEMPNDCGTIYIHGGRITATGGQDKSDEDVGGAGIGGGYDAAGGNVTIYGGVVTAKGGANAAGIGSGFQHKGGNVTIYGGTVTATGGKLGAGIGGGGSGRSSLGDGGNVKICGGTVNAAGGGFAAGIGGGDAGNGGNISITGGTVNASGGEYGAGIGGGSEGSGGTVSITGGTVTATGGKASGGSEAAMGIGKGDGVYPSGSLKLGSGVKMFISSDNETWSGYDSGSDTRKRYMRTNKPHTHNFTYSAVGATITATCTNEGCPLPGNKAMLTISKPPHTVYDDGKDAEAVITDEHNVFGDVQVVYRSGNGLSIQNASEDAPIDAGSYIASITVGGKTAKVTYTIAKAASPVNVTAEAAVKVNSEIPLSDNVDKNGAEGDVSYEPIGDTRGCTLRESLLTAGNTQGTVAVKVTVAADSNYEGTEQTINVLITGKDIQTIEAGKVDAKYGDTDAKIDARVIVTESGSGALSYAVKSGGDCIEVDTDGALTIKKPGTAYVTVTAAETTVGAVEYAKAIKDVKVTVSKADNPMTYREAQYAELTYSPFYQTIILDEAEVNHVEGEVSYEIISEKKDGENVNFCTLDGMALTIDADAPVGKYTLVVRATADGGDNYKSATAESTVTIWLEKDGSIDKEPEAKTLKYNGQAQELVKAGKAAGGDMVYALGENDTDPPADSKWSDSVPKGTEAGTYYVWYKIFGDINHNDTEPNCVIVKIADKTGESVITFDLNGGSLDGKTGTVTRKEKNGTVITLPAPVRDGYTFDYWEGSRYNAGDKYTVNGDHTFRAVWKTASGGSSRKGVKTGDDNYLAIWIALLLTSIAGTTVMALARKK